MHLGVFDQYVLLAILRLHPDGYGISVQDEIARRTGNRPTVSVVYAALARLTRHDLIRPRVGSATARRGGRSKRHFTVTPRGRRVLKAALGASDAMRAGLDI